jgi:hypothetical protein
MYGAAAAETALLPYSFSVTPGFWKAGEEPFLVRDPARWDRNVSNMLGSGARWQLVTTFNEWGEGTSVESAEEWASASGFGSYLDALHDATPSTPDPLSNVALGMPTTASGSWRKSPPSGAVDGVLDFIWNSGDYAPQWIEIDLGRSHRPDLLLTAQLPDGDTVHHAGKASAGDPTNRCMSSQASPPTISG